MGAATTELPRTAAGALIRRLETIGVDVVLVNSGTDFPPIIEALAEAESSGEPTPEFILVPHEHVAMGMAHGYYEATGRSQAVIMHTNVGLANGAIGAINAATDQVPVLLLSGRTPTTERDRFGSRTVPIGWGQEMRDQAALIREAAKWDYELRFPEQVPELIDRAYAIANSTPRGPVYLSLPREVLSEACPAEASDAPIGMQPAQVTASEEQIAEAAELLLEADNPLIIAQRGAGSVAGFDALARLADRYSIPVCQYWAVATAISSEHPLNVGPDPSPWVRSADVILVINSLAPWMPDREQPATDCRVVHLAPDPLFERFPIRDFRVDLAIRGEVGPALVELESAMDEQAGHAGSETSRAERRQRITEENEQRQERVIEDAKAGSGSPMSKEWVSLCLGEAVAGLPVTVVSELGCPLDPIGLTEHNSWRQEPHSGGLGWGFPFAMGMKLADPDRLVVATMGDGSYVFGNPVACHGVADQHGLGVLTIVLNNSGYGAVRQSVLHQYPNGYAAKAEEMPLTELPSAKRLGGVAAACGAYSETVDDGQDLPAALERALAHVTEQKEQAMLEVIVE